MSAPHPPSRNPNERSPSRPSTSNPHEKNTPPPLNSNSYTNSTLRPLTSFFHKTGILHPQSSTSRDDRATRQQTSKPHNNNSAPRSQMSNLFNMKALRPPTSHPCNTSAEIDYLKQSIVRSPIPSSPIPFLPPQIPVSFFPLPLSERPIAYSQLINHPLIRSLTDNPSFPPPGRPQRKHRTPRTLPRPCKKGTLILQGHS